MQSESLARALTWGARATFRACLGTLLITDSASDWPEAVVVVVSLDFTALAVFLRGSSLGDGEDSFNVSVVGVSFLGSELALAVLGEIA